MTPILRDDLRGILFDLDGVLYNDSELISGSVETVRWVQEHRIPHLFLTNTSSRSRADLANKLNRFGFPASDSQILTPAVAAAEWLRSQDAAAIALFVRTSARPEFANLACLPDGAEHGAAYVVVGDLGEQWDYRTLNRAFRLLHHNPQSQLIALGMTRYWLASDGISLDVAPFVAALEHATGRQALVFGKPAALFFRAAADRLGLPVGQVLMIGDDLQTDIGGAQAAGMKAVLVKTGKFRPSDLTGPVRPFAVLDSVATVPEWWPARFL